MHVERCPATASRALALCRVDPADSDARDQRQAGASRRRVSPRCQSSRPTSAFWEGARQDPVASGPVPARAIAQIRARRRPPETRQAAQATRARCIGIAQRAARRRARPALGDWCDSGGPVGRARRDRVCPRAATRAALSALAETAAPRRKRQSREPGRAITGVLLLRESGYLVPGRLVLGNRALSAPARPPR